MSGLEGTTKCLLISAVSRGVQSALSCGKLETYSSMTVTSKNIGYKHFLLAEAATFLKPAEQVSLSSTVKNITHTSSGVTVYLTDGTALTADHALVTFSVGVLQHQDVTFHPSLPAWKTEAIASMKMATYTKIFLIFPEKFWHSSEVRPM